MAYAQETRSLGDLFSDLSRELTVLVRSELQLARVEMSDKVSRAARHAGVVAGGAVVAVAGVLTLAAALVLVLVSAGMPPWGAALLVGIALVAAGAMMASQGLNALRRQDLKPTETLETLKEATAWRGQAN